jgi:hypothetical protein
MSGLRKERSRTGCKKRTLHETESDLKSGWKKRSGKKSERDRR